MPLTQLQQRVASLVTGLPEAEGSVLAAVAALAAHGVLDRTTRDLDDFGGRRAGGGGPSAGCGRAQAAEASGLDVRRDRQWEAFVRLRLADATMNVTTTSASTTRALGVVSTRYGPTLELRELGANTVLAIFARAEPRDVSTWPHSRSGAARSGWSAPQFERNAW